MREEEVLLEQGDQPITQTPGNKKNTKKKNTREKSRLMFYSVVVFLPLLQFCIFYIYVNFNSFVLAFQTTNQFDYSTSPAGFSNFKLAFKTLSQYSYMIKNSLILFVCVTVVGITLALIFSFYIYKKYLAAGIFRVILFVPKIIPSIVFAILFKYLATDFYKAVAELFTGGEVKGLLDAGKDSLFASVLFYNVWLSFGVNVILFTGSMSGINDAIVESAQIDGVSAVQEFWYITVPMIYPTIVTFIVVGIAAIFTNQMHLYTLFPKEKALPIGTIGYYIYLNARVSDVVAKSGMISYHELSAIGLILTAIIFPITMLARKLLTKFGPSVD